MASKVFLEGQDSLKDVTMDKHIYFSLLAPLNDRSYHAMHAKGSNDGDRVELDMGGKGPLNTWALNPKDVATFNYFIALQEVFKYLECPAEPASQVFINTQGDADQNGGTQVKDCINKNMKN